MRRIILAIILLSLVTVCAKAQWRRIAQAPDIYSYNAIAYDSMRKVIILYDYAGKTWQWNGIGWSILNSDGPIIGYGISIAFDSRRSKVVLVGGNNRNGKVSKSTWEWNGMRWKKVSTQGPRFQFGRAMPMAFDSFRNKMVTIVGETTWEWNGKRWMDLSIGGPTNRDNYAITFDEHRKKIILFGGYSYPIYYNDTWKYDGRTWIKLSDIISDNIELSDYSIVFNSQKSLLMLFANIRYYFNDAVFKWNGNKWVKLQEFSFSPLGFAKIVYDKTRNQMVAHNGFQEVSTWMWDGKKWSRKQTVVPFPGGGAKDYLLAYDKSRDRLFLRGSSSGGEETFEWDGSSWKAVWEKRGTRPHEFHAAMVYDGKMKKIILFGGEYYDSEIRYQYNDTWAWDGENWTKILSEGPEPRIRHCMAYDSDREVIVMFGGRKTDYDHYYYNETWGFNGQRWGHLALGGPEGRIESAMAYDAKRKRIVLFGGLREGQYFGDTWEWDGRNWTKVSDTGPSPRAEHTLVYDPNRGTTLLFGGTDVKNRHQEGRVKNDLWEWDGSEWRAISTDKKPAAVYNHGAAYDTSRGKMVIFGGFSYISTLLSVNRNVWYFGPCRPTISGSTDFTGDGRANPVIFEPKTGRWSLKGHYDFAFGEVGDVPVPGDYDGDGKAEAAIFRPRAGYWKIMGGAEINDFGELGDIPVPGDYDGDGKDDIALYRPKDGRWLIRGQFEKSFGRGTDVPVPADYNGDGKTEIAVYRAETGSWLFAAGGSKYLGRFDDVPVPADYDGDGKADTAVWRPSNGRWLIRNGDGTITRLTLGIEGDIPIPADYNGDGKAEIAVYRPNTGELLFLHRNRIVLGKPNSIPLN